MCLQPSSMTLVNPKNCGVESPFAWFEFKCKKVKSTQLANSHDEKKKISILPTPETSPESTSKIFYRPTPEESAVQTLSTSPVPNTKTSRVIDVKNTKFSKVLEIGQTNAHC